MYFESAWLGICGIYLGITESNQTTQQTSHETLLGHMFSSPGSLYPCEALFRTHSLGRKASSSDDRTPTPNAPPCRGRATARKGKGERYTPTQDFYGSGT